MKVKFTLIVLLAMALSTANVSGQVKKLTVQEFDSAVDLAYKASAKKNRREVTKNVVFEDGIFIRSHSLTDDYLLPDRRHWRLDSMFGNERAFSEWIIIGPDKFTKSTGKDWARTDSTGEYGDIRHGLSIKDDRETRTKYSSRKSFLAGRPVRILKSVETSRPNAVPFTHTFIYYVDSKGRVIKRVYKYIENGSAGNYEVDTTTYKYNVRGLRIEAPQMK